MKRQGLTLDEILAAADPHEGVTANDWKRSTRERVRPRLFAHDRALHWCGQRALPIYEGPYSPCLPTPKWLSRMYAFLDHTV